MICGWAQVINEKINVVVIYYPIYQFDLNFEDFYEKNIEGIKGKKTKIH